MSQPLSNRQKATLSQLYRQAWLRLGGQDVTDMSAAEFRRHHATKACGRQVSAAFNSDFTTLQADALALCGRADRALDAALKEETEPQRVALYKLRQELKRGGYPEGYADPIGQSRFKRPLEELSARELWWLVYTIRNNAARAKAAA